MSTQTETFEFKSEARQLLNLMINSLYTHKEIFLRELISNSSDALDKLRFEALTDPDLLTDDQPLAIRIETDGEERTLTLSDNGIGMTRQEVIDNLGTIARSGTRAFTERMAAAQTDDGATETLIGQFGVGFYSTFMVAVEVTVLTRRAGETEATRWMSTGDGEFEIASAERAHAGTTVIVKLRDADTENGLADFTQEWVVRQTVKKYSDFVTYPIELKTERTEVERDEDGEAVEDGEEKTVVEWETANSMKAIWARDASEVTDEEYTEFYKHISRDWEAPFERVAFKSEGTFEYDALLFMPSRPPFDLFYRDQKYGIHLYVNRVLIKSDADEFLPVWLRFLKGVVDSPDLSLNVSREMLHNDRRVNSIRKRIVKKVVDALARIQKDEPERYGTFWEHYGKVIKEGVADFEFGDKVKPLLWFVSSHDPEAYTTLADYVERMKDGQEAIYYITGESRAAVESSPHLEAFLHQGYEVLFLTDPVDEIVVGRMTEFDEKPLKSVGKGTAELGTDEEKAAAEEGRKEKQETHASLLERLANLLDEHLKEVRLSSRLTSSPVCLVGDDDDLSPQLERLLEASGQTVPKTKRIMELNPEHAILTKLQTLYDANPEDELIVDYAHLLHGQALIAEGSPLPDAAAFAKRVAQMMVG